MSDAASGLDIVAEVIRTYYDLGKVNRPVPLPYAHQRRHRKLVVETSAGKFLAKTYKRDPYVLDDLRFQHRLSAHLESSSIPVARIQPARSGKKIVEVDTWALELQEYVDGEGMIVSTSTLLTAGSTLGRFHTACSDFPRPPRDARMWRFSEVPRSIFATLYEKSLEEANRDRMTQCCNRLAAFLHEASDALSYQARDRFETGLIHGDWHAGNLIFKSEKLAAVVDLEFAGDGCYLEDLAYGLSNLCVRTTRREDRLEKRIEALMTAYQQYRELSWYEEAALFYAVGIKHVTTVAYQIQQLGKVAGLGAADWMERLDFQCAWLGRKAHKARWGH